MNNIQLLLERFRKHLSEGKELDTIVSEAITVKTGVFVELSALTVKDGVIKLSLHPAIKQDIILKKQDILDFINTNLPGYTIIDLR